MMKIAYLHYHLKTGGVTTVIKQQVSVLKDDCDTLVISGAAPESEFPADVCVVNGAGYTAKWDGEGTPSDVAEKIIKAIYSRWPDGCDILHVHNPVLAKNRYFLTILKILQKKGVRLFLQIHDFAEDGRPASYFQEEYPSDCHYGVINSRDYDILLHAGLHKDGLHNLFNMVKTLDSVSPSENKSESYILYPVRAIRRKNIGEAILISLFLKNREKLMVTLPPNSEQDIRSHNGWKRFVLDNKLDVEFDASSRYNFIELVANAKFILTTSITEGFGFSFSEPWTAWKNLWGRKIPDICADFERNGVIFPDFYSHLHVPLDWVGKNAFFEKWTSCIRENLTLFGMNENELGMNAWFDKMTKHHCIDFGILNEYFQKKVLVHIIRANDALSEMKRINPFLSDLNPMVPESVIEGNNEAIRENYSTKKYRMALLRTYDKIMTTNVGHAIDKKKLLSSFINSQEFSLLKWGPYDDSPYN